MRQNIDIANAFVTHEEGGYTADRRDDGNWSSGHAGEGVLIGSNKGVGAPAAIGFMHKMLTASWMRSLPSPVQRGIFGIFWRQVSGDAMPAGLDLMLADHGWNRGARTSVMVLQRLLDIEADGSAGPDTLATVSRWRCTDVLPSMIDVRALQRHCGMIDDGLWGEKTRQALSFLPAGEQLLVCLYAAQVRDYKRLDNFGTYGRGWLARAERRLSAGIVLATAPGVSVWTGA